MQMMIMSRYQIRGSDNAGFVRYSVISILVLVGALPLAAGVLFGSTWLRWTGVALVGLAAVLALVHLILVAFFRLRSHKGER